MAANCVQDLEAAVKAVKEEYGNDPKWASAIQHGEEALKAAQEAEAPSAESPGQKAANAVHEDVKNPKQSNLESNAAPETEANAKPESPNDDKTEPAAHENGENGKVEQVEHSGENPKDMSGAAKLALIMLRKKK